MERHGQLFHDLTALIGAEGCSLIEGIANLAGNEQAGDQCNELAQLECFIFCSACGIEGNRQMARLELC